MRAELRFASQAGFLYHKSGGRVKRDTGLPFLIILLKIGIARSRELTIMQHIEARGNEAEAEIETTELKRRLK
jgi:hypothetical protein